MKRFVVFLFFVGWVVASNAQKMEDYFIRMPNELIAQLEEAWRKDLVILYKSGKSATLDNTMQGKSTLQKLTDHYILLQTTERSTVEMKLLPLVNNTYIIGMIETVCAPVADSRVTFYTTEWQRVDAESIFTPIDPNRFLKTDVNRSSPEYLYGSSKLDISLIKYSLSDENMILTAEYMTPLYLDEESRQKVKPLLKSEPQKYEWKAGRFEFLEAP